jgi:carboxyl-terminal processing protease
MTARTRLWVLSVSTPLIVFALVGGYLGQAQGRDDTYQHLRIFDDVVSHVMNNYVEEVDISEAMRGAMRGLSDSLDSDSSYLTAELVEALETGERAGPADVGLELTRQYYLRVVSARDGSPAARAGLRPGDYLRAIDGRATRTMSAYEGARLLEGPAGSSVELLVIRGNAAEPHELTLVREIGTGDALSSRMAAMGTGYVRVAAFTSELPAQLTGAFETLGRQGASRVVIDLRGTAVGGLDDGIAAARLFVPDGVLAIRETKSGRETIAAGASDGAIDVPVALLVDQGTSGAAELFAAALADNERAELLGQRTLGRTAQQQLVKLPDGSGLLLSAVRYLSPSSEDIHERGLAPDIAVRQPEIEFGAAAPAGDATLERAVERLADRPAA